MSGRSILWLVVPGIAILCALGTWQVQRLQWKEALIATIAARAAEDPVPLQSLAVETADPDAIAFRRVTITGSYDHEASLMLVPRVHGGRPGGHVLTPLRLDGGGTVLVERGWVPTGAAPPSFSTPAGPVTETGVIKLPVPQAWITPDNDPTGGTWYWIDLDAIAGATGHDLLPVIVAAAGDVAPGTLPVPRPPTPDLPNNHLQYVVTWYGLAVALAAVGWAFVRRRSPRSR